ncbi:MAG: hypothetical protein HC836_46940 [Richelia sp. RM2_1_2]|nr:hypothetical protein [Richelia sp. RM2_1_2]
MNKDISDLRKKHENSICKVHCKVISTLQCPKSHCTCKVAAEIKAFIEAILPQDYINCKIDQFNGRLLDGTIAIENSFLKEAKENLILYCNGPRGYKKYKENVAYKNIPSYMDERRDSGDNLVIYADSNTKVDIPGKIIKKTPKGKTMLASIVMKEAIKRRGNGRNYHQTYGWWPYSRLKKALQEESRTNEEICQIPDLLSMDWLVVDDIWESPEMSENKSLIL